MTTELPKVCRSISHSPKFSLAANYDPEVVSGLAAYPVDEIYGKFHTDGISGGRPRYLATPLSKADLRHYIRLLDHHGIAFNYLLNCPLQSYHQNSFAHASDNTHMLFIDYCLLSCSRLRLTDPSRFIKTAWIRSEDMAVYEAMGYTTFKLLERGIPSAALLQSFKAYSEKRFSGNLAELLLPYGFKEPIRWFRIAAIIRFKTGENS